MIRLLQVVPEKFLVLFLVSIFGASFQRAQAATLIHTNDVLGDIEPCGCRSNPQGGMARKYNLVKRLEDSFVLQLDAGDLLFPASQVPDPLVEQSQLQAEYLIKSMDLTQHSAVVPGEKDYALGFKVFEKLRKKAKMRFLAANLKKRDGGRYLNADAIFSGKDAQGNNLKIGVFGIVGEDLSWPKELKATSAVTAAKNEVKLLRKKVDILIALSHQGLDADQVLAKKVSGIDFIIGGHSQSFLQNPVKINSTYIFQSSFRNQYVGKIPLVKPFNAENYKMVGLDAGYDSPAEAPSSMDQLVKEFKASIARLNSQRDAALAASSLPLLEEGEEVKYQTFPRCAECHYKQFNFWRKTAHARALEPLVEKEQFKNKECLTCHTLGLGDPKGFNNVNVLAEYTKLKPGQSEEDLHPIPMPMADLRSFLKVLNEKKSMNDSVQLTVTDPSRTIRDSLNFVTRAWTPVQCENCHLPGRSHPLTENYSKKVAQETCIKCHTAERAPEWFFSDGKPKWDLIGEKRKRVTCPAGDESDEDAK